MGVGSVLAVIFGLVARRQIKERNEAGDGMAIAGIVLGILGIIGIVVFIIVVIAVADDLENYDSYDEFENVDMIRAGLTLAWDNVATGLAGVRTALVGS